MADYLPALAVIFETLQQVIKTLTEIGNISPAQGKDAKAHYEQLHSALVAAMAREKALLEQAKQLAKDAQVQHRVFIRRLQR